MCAAMFSCRESKEVAKESPYKALADQYAEFTLTTDMTKLTENEKKMIPILIEIAEIMDDIFWQNAYGDKKPLFAAHKDAAARKFLLVNYGPWDRLNDNKPFLPGVGEKRKKAILKHFSTVEALKNASVEEICAVPGVSRPAAENVYAMLHASDAET